MTNKEMLKVLLEKAIKIETRLDKLEKQSTIKKRPNTGWQQQLLGKDY